MSLKNQLKTFLQKSAFLLAGVIGFLFTFLSIKAKLNPLLPILTAIGTIMALVHLFRYFYNEKYRRKHLEYIKTQLSLPSEQRRGYGLDGYFRLGNKVVPVIVIFVFILIFLHNFLTNS